jgi:hypothetical protein
MRTIFRIIVLAAFLSISFQMQAQKKPPFAKEPKKNHFVADTNKTPLNFAISIVPTYAFQYGFRLDLDFHLTKNQWLVFGPQYYIARDQYMDILLGIGVPVDMDGFGFDLYHKILIFSEQTVNGPYVAYGIRYNHFSFRYTDNVWVEKTDPWGTKYYDWEETDITEVNNRYGFNLLFGAQYAVNNRLLIDGFLGCGLQVSDISPDDAKIGEDNNYFGMFNYSGPRLTMGFRLGMFLF